MQALVAPVLVVLVTARAVAPMLGAEGAATPAPATGLPPLVWHLTAIVRADGSETVPDDPTTYTLQFLPYGTVAVRADCHRSQATYTVEGQCLTISAVPVRRVTCPPGSLGEEYANRLSEVVSYLFEQDRLVLALGSDAGSLRFAPTLGSVVWRWQAFRGGNDAEIVPDDPAKYTIEFLPDGTVAVRADCNRGTGTYAVDGDRLDIAIEAMTEVGCPPGSLGDRFVGDLDDVLSHVFREGTLHVALPADDGIHAFVAHLADDAPVTPTAG